MRLSTALNVMDVHFRDGYNPPLRTPLERGTLTKTVYLSFEAFQPDVDFYVANCLLFNDLT